MNSEAEKQLISLLLKSENNENVSLPSYPRLNSDTVKIISKTITKIVYDSLKNENTTSKNNRDAVIGLLSKWSKNNADGHLNINAKNRGVVLKCLHTNDKVIDPLFEDFYRSSLLEKNGNDVWDNIYNTLNEANKVFVDNKTSRDLIQALDSINLKNRGFICTVPNKIIHKNDFEVALSLLKEMSNENNTNKFLSSIKNKKNNSNLPELGYALLLERNKENDRLLTKIVSDLVKKSHLLKDESDFLNYLWTNANKLNLSPDLYKKIVKSCRFLYEKLLLDIGCEIIITNNPDYRTILFNSNLSNILPSLKENKMLYCNILNCIYELYFLSNYDVRLRDFLFTLKEIVTTYE